MGVVGCPILGAETGKVFKAVNDVPLHGGASRSPAPPEFPGVFEAGLEQLAPRRVVWSEAIRPEHDGFCRGGVPDRGGDLC